MLKYDPSTGVFTRNGVVIGSKSKGTTCTYYHIRHRGKVRKAHRVAFEMMGVSILPGIEVDHINRDSLDNRWDNLRLVTRSEQQKNKRIYTNSTSGIRGYRFRSDRKQQHTCRLYKDGVPMHASFTTKPEALAWLQANK